MNTPSSYPQSLRSKEKIDRTLRALGSVQPRAGIEGRIAARLAQASLVKPSPIAGWSRLIMASAAGVVACAVIVGGTVSHSRHLLPNQPGIPIPAETRSGLGAAGTTTVAPKPIVAPAHGRARSMRNTQHQAATGHDDVSSDAPKPQGIGVPKSPVPQR